MVGRGYKLLSCPVPFIASADYSSLMQHFFLSICKESFGHNSHMFHVALLRINKYFIQGLRVLFCAPYFCPKKTPCPILHFICTLFFSGSTALSLPTAPTPHTSLHVHYTTAISLCIGQALSDISLT